MRRCVKSGGVILVGSRPITFGGEWCRPFGEVDFFGDAPRLLLPLSPDDEADVVPELAESGAVDDDDPVDPEPDEKRAMGWKVGSVPPLMIGRGLCADLINTSSNGLVDFLGVCTRPGAGNGVDSAPGYVDGPATGSGGGGMSSRETYSMVGPSSAGKGGVVLRLRVGTDTSTCSLKATAFRFLLSSFVSTGAVRTAFTAGGASKDGRDRRTRCIRPGSEAGSLVITTGGRSF